MTPITTTITASRPLAKAFPSIPMTLCSAGLEVLVPKSGILLLRDNDSTEAEVKTITWQLWTLHASESTSKEECCLLTWLINLDYQGHWISIIQE